MTDETGDTDLAVTADAAKSSELSPLDERPAPQRRRVDRGLLVASLIIASGAVLVVWGLFVAVTGDEGVDRPAAIETLTPVENAIQVLQQEPVIIDLEFGYEGALTIDGVDVPITRIGEIDVEPGEQLDLPPTAIFDPGNSIISFQPVDGAVIESFSAGVHQVQLVYWRIEEGPDAARSYTWSFNAV